MNIPQISIFQVCFINGQIINELIENIHQLYDIIRIYGRGFISKISFYYHTNEKQNHNLILQNCDKNDRFIVEFCNSYNQNFQTVEMTLEEKYKDFQAVKNILQNNDLNYILLPFIKNPLENIT